MFLKILHIDDLIKFNDENFNSKIIKENNEEKIVAFALKKEQKLNTHFSPTDAMITVLYGEIIVNIKNNNYTLQTNDLFMIPAKNPHSVIAKEDSKFTVIRM